MEKIPQSFVTSPAMIPIGLAISLLYGIVLYGVVTARKASREAERAEARVASAEIAPSQLPEIVEPSKSDHPSANAEPPKVEASPLQASEPTPRPETKPPAEPVKTVEVASNDIPPPKAVAPVVPADGQGWGRLEGTLFDCQGKLDRTGLIVEIPGEIHVLSNEAGVTNAPRFLTSVQGDFSASVSVQGEFSPGSEPLTDTGFTFQGAGLLVWSDENNYIRFERTEGFSPGGKAHALMIEVCRNRKTSKPIFQKIREADTVLKLDRKGAEFRCQYTLDGKSWIDFRRLTVELPAALKVGVSAANVSPKPFAPRFDHFEMSDPSTKSAKGS